MEHFSQSEKETLAIGKQIAQTLRGGDVIALHGDLGAGKTTLVKGIAAGLGVKNDITSPTFTLMNVYEVHSPSSIVHSLVHIDTYRLKDEKELTAIGAEDFLGAADTICVIEWPEKIPNLLKNKKTTRISLAHRSVTERTITTDVSSSQKMAGQ